jgi:hypothetical protein
VLEGDFKLRSFAARPLGQIALNRETQNGAALIEQGERMSRLARSEFRSAIG